MEKLNEIYEKVQNLTAQMRSIVDDNPDGLSAELAEQCDRIDAEISELEDSARSLEAHQRFAARTDSMEEFLNSSAGRSTPASQQIARQDSRAQAHIRVGRNELRMSAELSHRASSAYHEAFLHHIATGHPSAALQQDSDEAGGYLVPVATMDRLIQAIDNETFMRQIAMVLPPLVGAKSIGCPSLDADPADPSWTAEVGTASEDSTMDFGKREMTPHQLTKYIKVSRKMMRNSPMSIEALVAERFGYKFGVSHENAFLNGNGAGQPLGVFVASDDGVTTSQDVATGSTTNITADGLIDALHGLKSQYIGRASWLWHRDALKRIRKLKDGDGQYLWNPGLASDRPATILGRPYYLSEYAPNTFTSNQYVGIVGDFSQYWILDSAAFEIQRLNELYALNNQVAFVARGETDGAPVLAEAFRRLKCATS